MAESALPLPPQDEFDGDRHVHPYVREKHADLSVYGYTTANGHEFTKEDRSRESRIAFHIVEAYLGHLSPTAMVVLIQALMHRLFSEPLAEEFAGIGKTFADMDPRGELVPFERVHGEQLREIMQLVDEILSRCPRCGRPFPEHKDAKP